MQRALIVEQVLDEVLQLDAVVAHDADDLALRRRERSADLVVQQLRALAQRGERRLELVGEVAQEPVLLGLELGEAAAQPVQALAQRLQVLRTRDRDRTVEVRGAELPDRSVELADRPRDVPRERERDAERGCGTFSGVASRCINSGIILRPAIRLTIPNVSSLISGLMSRQFSSDPR